AWAVWTSKVLGPRRNGKGGLWAALFVCGRPGSGDGAKDLPRLGDPLQRMGAEILEFYARARDQVLHGARNQHIVGAAELRHPRSDVHRDPPHVILGQLDFACMKTDAHRNLESTQRIANGAGAMDRPGRPIEGGEETVAQGLHFSSTETRKLLPHRLVMRFKKIAPRSIALGVRAFG